MYLSLCFIRVFRAFENGRSSSYSFLLMSDTCDFNSCVHIALHVREKKGPTTKIGQEKCNCPSFCVKFHTKKKKRDFSQIFGFVVVINLFRWCFVVLFSPKRREKQKQKKKTKKKRDRRGTEEETRLC
jgi:hypothetical protein